MLIYESATVLVPPELLVQINLQNFKLLENFKPFHALFL